MYCRAGIRLVDVAHLSLHNSLVRCQAFLWHLYHRWALDRAEVYVYLLKHVAHLVQYPGVRTNVMPVLHSLQGAGKGIILDKLCDVIGHWNVYQAQDWSHVVGQFNDHLGGKLLIIIEEMKADRQAANRLKTLITEKHLQLNRKNAPMITVENNASFVACGNDKHVAYVEARERRACVIRVANELCIPKTTAKEAVLKGLTNLDPYSLAHLLHAVNLHGFNPRIFPTTSGTLDQLRRGLSVVHRWVWETLKGAAVTELWTREEMVDKVYQDFLQNYCSGLQYRPALDEFKHDLEPVAAVVYTTIHHNPKQNQDYSPFQGMKLHLEQSWVKLAEFLAMPVEALKTGRLPASPASQIQQHSLLYPQMVREDSTEHGALADTSFKLVESPQPTDVDRAVMAAPAPSQQPTTCQGNQEGADEECMCVMPLPPGVGGSLQPGGQFPTPAPIRVPSLEDMDQEDDPGSPVCSDFLDTVSHASCTSAVTRDKRAAVLQQALLAPGVVDTTGKLPATNDAEVVEGFKVMLAQNGITTAYQDVGAIRKAMCKLKADTPKVIRMTKKSNGQKRLVGWNVHLEELRMFRV